MFEDNMLHHRPFPSKDSSDQNTMEHSPFSIFRSRALSSLPNFPKRFVWSSIRLTRGDITIIIWFAANPSWPHENSAWTKGAIWNTSNFLNPVDRLRRTSIPETNIFSTLNCSENSSSTPKTWQTFCTADTSSAILNYIPYIAHFSEYGTSALIGGNWQWLWRHEHNLKQSISDWRGREGSKWPGTSENRVRVTLADGTTFLHINTHLTFFHINTGLTEIILVGWVL